jgi:hypothetical protein
MQLHDYINLDLSHKACVLCEHGVFVEKHIDYERIASLYYLNNFYIEIVVSADENHIVEIVPFKSGERLEKYLKGVDLAAIL